MATLERLGPSHREEAAAFCAEHPDRAAYVGGWVHERGLERRGKMPRAHLFAERIEDGPASKRPIRGLVLILDSGIVLPINLSEAGRAAFITMHRSAPESVRVMVGERTEVDRLWVGLERLGARARLWRDQCGMALDRTRFQPQPMLALTQAAAVHLPELVRASAAMAREEARDDPQGRNPRLFETRIRERVERGRDFVHVLDGRLAFKTNVAALSPVCGQIEGIYTAPTVRRQGLGLAGTAWITAWVLDRASRAFLLVNEDNQEARRIYARLGYQVTLLSRTVFAAP